MQSHVIRLPSGAQQHSILLLLTRFHVDRYVPLECSEDLLGRLWPFTTLKVCSLDLFKENHNLFINSSSRCWTALGSANKRVF